MKKLIFTMLLLISHIASAEWVKTSESSVAKNYVDDTSAKRIDPKNRDIISVWTLTDLNQGLVNYLHKYYMSTLSHSKIDCKEEKESYLEIRQYSENMRNGFVVGSAIYKEDDWHGFAEGDVGLISLRMTCLISLTKFIESENIDLLKEVERRKSIRKK